MLFDTEEEGYVDMSYIKCRDIKSKIAVIFVMAAVLFTSIPATGFAAAVKPGAIYTIAAKDITSESAVIRWGKAKGKVSGYAIYRNGKLIKSVNAKTHSFKNTKLKYSTKYQYYVRAYNLTGKKVRQYYNKKTKKWQSKLPAQKYRGGTRLVNSRVYGAASPKWSVKTMNPIVIHGKKITPSMCPLTFTKAGTECKVCGQGIVVKVSYNKKTEKYSTTLSGKDYSKNCHHHNSFDVCACAGDAGCSISEIKTKGRWFSVNGFEINPSNGEKIGTQTKDVHSDTFRKADLEELKSLTYGELAELYSEAESDSDHKWCQGKRHNGYKYCKDCNKIVLK